MAFSHPIFNLNLSSFHHKLSSLSFENKILSSFSLSLIFYGLGGGISYKNKKLIFFYPSIVYDLLQHICYPINYLLGLLCYILPTRHSKWSEINYKQIQLIGTGKKDIKEDLINQKNIVYNEEDLVLLFDQCQPIQAEELIGNTWNGKIIRTNRSLLDIAEWLLVRPLGLFGFKWGKRYRTQHVGDPLLVRWLNFI